MYGKLIDGEISFAPAVVYLQDRTVCSPSDELLEELGYKVIVLTEAPEVPVGYYAQLSWTESDDAITQSWELVAKPDDAELTSAEALSIILGGA